MRQHGPSKARGSVDGLSRREVLLTATVAGALTSLSSVRADAAPATAFGAPLVEIHVPAGVLTAEQKTAMIRGITDVILRAMKQPNDVLQPAHVRTLLIHGNRVEPRVQPRPETTKQ